MLFRYRSLSLMLWAAVGKVADQSGIYPELQSHRVFIRTLKQSFEYVRGRRTRPRANTKLPKILPTPELIDLSYALPLLLIHVSV